MSKSASDFFAEVPRRYNCAQSVAAGAGREDLIPAMAAMGGGRAPEGICGALYAALQLLPEEKQAAAMAEMRELARGPSGIFIASNPTLRHWIAFSMVLLS